MKNLILSALQIPFLWSLVITEKYKLLLMRILSKLDNPASHPIRDKAAQEVATDQGDNGLLFFSDKFAEIETKSDIWVDVYRLALEGTRRGLETVRSHPNRRLYAVLYPSRTESLQRIKNVLVAYEGFLTVSISEAKKIVQGSMKKVDEKLPSNN